MNEPPQTSVTLLKAISDDSANSRWCEFCRLYEPMMRGYLQSQFPTVEPDDILQETLVSLMRALPNYHYTPDGGRHFHNYLVGILKHKAEDEIRRRAVHAQKLDRLRTIADLTQRPADNAWKEALMETAIAQLLADTSINAMHREVFRAVALNHERPEDVAERFGLSRGNVDVIKGRLIGHLAELVKSLQGADAPLPIQRVSSNNRARALP